MWVSPRLRLISIKTEAQEQFYKVEKKNGRTGKLQIEVWRSSHGRNVIYTEWTQHGGHHMVNTGQGREALEKDGRSSEFSRENTATLASIREKR